MEMTHYWPLNGDTYDYGTEGSLLKLNNNTNFYNGIFGKCMISTHSDVKCIDLENKNIFCVSIWAYVSSSVSKHWANIICLSGNSNGKYFAIRFDNEMQSKNPNNSMYFHDNSEGHFLTNSVSCNMGSSYNAWHNYVMNSDGKNLSLYLDKELVAKYSINQESKLNGSITAHDIDGIKVSNIKIFDYCLTNNEIEDLYYQPSINYTYDEYFGISDGSGFNNDMTGSFILNKNTYNKFINNNISFGNLYTVSFDVKIGNEAGTVISINNSNKVLKLINTKSSTNNLLLNIYGTEYNIDKNISPDDIYHIDISVNNKSLKLYIDGEILLNKSISENIILNDISLGDFNDCANNALSTFYSLKVYNMLLPENKIIENYKVKAELSRSGRISIGKINCINANENILYRSDLEVGSMADANGDLGTMKSRLRTKFVPVVSGIKYSISCKDPYIIRYIHKYDENKKWISSSSIHNKFKCVSFDNNIKYIKFVFQHSNGSEEFSLDTCYEKIFPAFYVGSDYKVLEINNKINSEVNSKSELATNNIIEEGNIFEIYKDGHVSSTEFIEK